MVYAALNAFAGLLIVVVLACGSIAFAQTPDLLPTGVTNVPFPASSPGLMLSGLLYRPVSAAPAPTIVIMSGTSGRSGFPNWETPWAQRLQRAGYVAFVVDSYTGRGLPFSEHWRVQPSQRSQDALDAAAFLARQPYVRADEMGLIGRSGGGTAVLGVVAKQAGQTRSLPFKMAVADYGYCQNPYGDWPGGTSPASGPATAFRAAIPLLVTTGTNDDRVPAASCEALVASAQGVGSPLTLMVFAGAEHAFDALYGNATPQQRADVINAIAALIAADVAAAPTGTPISVTAVDFSSHVGPNGTMLVVPMQPQNGPGSAPGNARVTGSASGTKVAINLEESSSHAIAQIREGNCAQLSPNVAYNLDAVVDGIGSGALPSVQLGQLMNGHFAIVVVANANAALPSACGDIPASAPRSLTQTRFARFASRE
jgi:dienelactone hydrolase